MIKTIAIEREYGCGAGGIAQKLADHLGWKLWDHELSNEIARRLNCGVDKVKEREERPDSAMYRLMKIFMRGSYEASFSGHVSHLLDAEGLRHHFEEIINDVAKSGSCVIVGRTAPWVLRDRKDNLSVFFYASRDEKMRRLQQRGKDAGEAEELIDSVDRDRAAFISHYYNVAWPKRDLYHLMVNTGSGDKAAIELLLHEKNRLDRAT